MELNSLVSSLGLVKACGIIIISLLLIAAIKLVVPILKPTIISYPWKLPQSEKEREKDKKLTVVLAGSYNPVHNGHMMMLKYLSMRFKRVIVVIGTNPNKQYLVSAEQRAELLRRCFESDPDAKNIEVEVVTGLIWRFAKREGATIFFRGIRSWETDGKDERSLQILNTWGPLVLGPLFWPLPTIYLEGNPKYNKVSSTLIRNICGVSASGALLAGLVPDKIASSVAQLYSREATKRASFSQQSNEEEETTHQEPVKQS